MNETLKSIAERSSTRNFSATALSAAEIEFLKKAALAAPTAVDSQNNRFTFTCRADLIAKANQLVISAMEREGDLAMLKRLKERKASSIFYGAPLLIVIHSQDSRYADLDAGIAVQNLALAAHALGLGSCINGMSRRAFERERADNLCQEFGFAAKDKFRIAIAIGHIASTKAPHDYDQSHIIEIK